MARTTESWKHFRDRRTGKYFVRFRFEGRRLNISTGERDPEAAADAAARIYAEVVSGRWRPGRAVEVLSPAIAFDEVAARWLADIEPHIESATFQLYRDIYVKRHLAPFFVTMDRVSTLGVEDYISKRLREVRRVTLKAELCALRRIARWAYKRGYLRAMPEVEIPGRRALGTPAGKGKGAFQVFTADEVGRILAHLPEQSWSRRRSKRGVGSRFAVRARFIVAWETALRPATLNKLRAPEHYRKGAAALNIRAEIDKNRFARELPLSEAAREALDCICPENGLLFGKHDYRAALRGAARRAGIDRHRAERISAYDFRHSRLTHLGMVTDNLSGVMYLAGHKQPQTTARYMRPQKVAAEEVLLAELRRAPRRPPSRGLGGRDGPPKGLPALEPPAGRDTPPPSSPPDGRMPQRRFRAFRSAPPAAMRAVRVIEPSAENDPKGASELDVRPWAGKRARGRRG